MVFTYEEEQLAEIVGLLPRNRMVVDRNTFLPFFPSWIKKYGNSFLFRLPAIFAYQMKWLNVLQLKCQMGRVHIVQYDCIRLYLLDICGMIGKFFVVFLIFLTDLTWKLQCENIPFDKMAFQK